MESSRFAFLLARFLGLNLWIGGAFDATYALDHLLGIETSRYAATQHYYIGILGMGLARAVLHAAVGTLFWLNAERVGHWLEGVRTAEQPETPPLSMP